VRRLGLGTSESHARLQSALEQLWPFTVQLFAALPGESGLVAAGWVTGPAELQAEWLEQVRTLLTECDLTIPVLPDGAPPRSQHTPDLKTLIDELQSVARQEPSARW
jgi:ring-1,2-phenylacetyl-CoA epoxidase subunit PaaC